LRGKRIDFLFVIWTIYYCHDSLKKYNESIKVPESIIEIRNLKKVYDKPYTEALKGINLSISKGEFYGLLGPNSAGKTTLISIICGIVKMSEGSATIASLKINGSSSAFKKIIGLVPQDIALYPTLTVKENLQYFGQMQGLYGKLLKDRIDEYAQALQLTQHLNKKITICSGGIKRRANIAAGVIHNPDVFILDEPTVGVDTQSRNLIFDYLMQKNAEGTTILYTTHYMEEAENLCSVVTIIDEGNVIESGSPADLINKYSDLNNLGEVFLKLTGKNLRE